MAPKRWTPASMARARWSGTTREQRAEHARAAAQARWATGCRSSHRGDGWRVCLACRRELRE